MTCRLWTMSRSLPRYLRFALCVVFRPGRSVSTKPQENRSSKPLGAPSMSNDLNRRWIEDMEAGAIGGHR